METTTWYHGGDLENGAPKGEHLYVTDNHGHALLEARKHSNGAVYRLRAAFNHLVVDYHDGTRRKVVSQTSLSEHGGAIAVFEKLPVG